jgi:Mn-dependent DtxR family transcriptional regulator
MITGRPPYRQKQTIIYLLAYHDQHKTYPNNTQIAQYFNISTPSVSVMMDRLADRKLIKRHKAKIISVAKKALEFVKE